MRSIVLGQLAARKLAWLSWRNLMLRNSRARGVATARGHRVNLMELNRRWNQWKMMVTDEDRRKVRTNSLSHSLTLSHAYPPAHAVLSPSSAGAEMRLRG